MEGGSLGGRPGTGLRRVFALFSAVLLLSGLVYVLVHTPTHPAYFYVGPGAAYDTARMVAVDGGHPAVPGHLFMLTVTTQPASLFWQLYTRLDHRGELEPATTLLGAGRDYSQYLKDEAAEMEDSQMTAMAVAEQAAGLPARIEQQGAEVKGTVAGAPADGVLKRGDVIVKLGATPVYSQEDLHRALVLYKPGDPVTLTLKRDGNLQTVTVTSRAAADDPVRPELGVYVQDARPKFEIPVPVKIQSGNITGPSAGLMFSLQIVSQVEGKDLSHGLRVAGTGTISAGGRVGPIGAVVQKVYTAEAAGADVMFVPRDNYEEARRVPARLRLVPVDTLQDALDWLAANARTGG